MRSFIRVALSFVCASASAIAGAEEEVRVVPERTIVLSPQSFEATVFGEAKIRPTARHRMEEALTEETRVIERACSLSEAQMRKLHLAGRGDIKQFFERIDELRAEYEGLPLTNDEATRAVVALRAVAARFEPGKKAGMFDETSLFRKTLRGMLTEEQLAHYAASERARHVALVESVLSSFGDRTVGVKLAPHECQKLAQLLIEKSNPPAAWGSYTHYVVLLQLSELEDEVQRVVDDASWPGLQKQFALAWKIEPNLRRLGVWPTPSPRPALDAEKE